MTMFEPRFGFGVASPPAGSALIDLIGGQGDAVFTPWSVGSAADSEDAEIAPDDAFDSYAAGFAAGHAARLADLSEAAASNDAALAAIAHAVERMATTHPAATAETLAAALSRLLANIVGEIHISAATLQSRAADLLAAVDATAAPTALHCHPADAAVIGPGIAPIAVQPDPAMPRGSLRLATSTGWIDDSIADRLAHIDAALAAYSVA